MKKKKNVKRAPEGTIKKIRKAMEACTENGIKIIEGDWGVEINEEKKSFVPENTETPYACALGALLVHKNGSVKFDEFRGRRPLSAIEVEETAAHILGVDEDWVLAFIDGFDGSDIDSTQADIGYEAWDHDGRRTPNGLDGRLIRNATPLQLEMRRAYNMGKKLREEFI